MMRFFKRFVPILLSFFIVCGVIFSSYDTAKATGMEEYLYVTYWDMMNTLYAMCGYDMKVSDAQINTHGVTGKQVWNNFTSFVENTAKVHWKLYSDAGKAAVNELKNLVNTATEKGISMSQDLFDMLKDVFGYQVKYANNQNQFDCSSVGAVNDYIKSLTGGGYLDSQRSESLVNGKALLNIIYDPYYPAYSVFTINKSEGMAYDYVKKAGRNYFVFYILDNSGEKSCYTIYGSSVRNGNTMLDVSCCTAMPGFTWIVKNGAFVGTDVVSAQVSAGACPKEVPDVQPWIKSPDIPDEFRIVKPGEAPGQKPDPDEHPDWLPGIIPFKPKTP